MSGRAIADVLVVPAGVAVVGGFLRGCDLQ